MREWFRGWGERARAAIGAATTFLAIVLSAVVFTTHALQSTTNGVTHVIILVGLTLAVMAAVSLGRKAYKAAAPETEEEE